MDLAWGESAAYSTGRGDIWLGGTEEHAGFDSSTSDAARASILERVARLLPGLGEVRVLRQAAALRPVTPDGFPILGHAPGWDNVCLVLGGGRKGMLLSAAMGRAVAELMVSGVTTLPIGGCSPGRETLRRHAEALAC
jgi:glycine/D-amino acid oxidase-like deaminating enzyme